MFKTLILLKIRSFFQAQVQSSKSKKAGIGRAVFLGILFLYLVIVFFGMFTALFRMIIEPMQYMHIEWLYFAIMSLCIIMLSFIGSIFLTHHELYEANDNELLMSMPIKSHDILLSRIFSILLLNYLYEFPIAVPAFYVYFTHIGMSFLQVLIFLLVVLTLPLFVVVLSSLFSWILAHILVHIRFKNVMTVIMFLSFMVLYFYIVNSIEDYLRYLIIHGVSIAQAIQQTLYPVYQLSIAIENSQLSSLMIYLLCVIIPFIFVLMILSKNFVRLATEKPQPKKKIYVKKEMAIRSTQKALLMREFKHFTSNAMVMLNAAAGVTMSLFAIVGLLVYQNSLLSTLSTLSPYFNISYWIMPIACFALMTLSSTNIMSASSISLEGRHLWLLKSIPVPTKQILFTKFFFHLLVCTPTSLILAFIFFMIYPVSFIDAFLILISPVVFTVFTDLLGLLLNIWKPRLDWRNETACVKQSMPVTLTMFISLGTLFVIIAIYGVLQFILSPQISVALIFIILTGVNIFLYRMLMTWGVRTFEQY